MVSEDPDQVVPGLLAIHRRCDFRDVRQTRVGPVYTGINQLDAADELLKISLLR